MLAALRDVVRDVPDALVEPTLPGVRNGGDILMHLRLPDSTPWPSLRARLDEVLSAPAVTHVDSACYRGRPVGPDEPGGSVYRALLLRVAPDTADDVIKRFDPLGHFCGEIGLGRSFKFHRHKQSLYPHTHQRPGNAAL